MAEDNIKLVEIKNDYMWFKDSPIIICAFRVAVDMNTGDMFTSAKFLNVAPFTLREMTFDIICYDQMRQPICYLTDITYRDLDVKRNTDFGYHRKIEITDLDTRNVEYIVKSVVYDNGQVWRNSGNRRFDTKIDQKSIYTVQGDTNKQFRDICARSGIDGLNLVLQPVFEEDHWLCACGAFNWADETQCSQCSVNRDWLKKNTDPEFLRLRKEQQDTEIQRIREQVQERERTASADNEARRMQYEHRNELVRQEQKKQKRRKMTRGTILALSILLAVALLIFILMTFVFPDFLADDKEQKERSSKVSLTVEDIPAGGNDIII